MFVGVPVVFLWYACSMPVGMTVGMSRGMLVCVPVCVLVGMLVGMLAGVSLGVSGKGGIDVADDNEEGNFCETCGSPSGSRELLLEYEADLAHYETELAHYETELAQCEAELAQWQERAEAAEQRVRELEAQLAQTSPAAPVGTESKSPATGDEATLPPQHRPEKAHSADGFAYFGTYRNTAAGSDPIAWQVIKRTEAGVLLLAARGLDCRPYHDSAEPVSWDACALRRWLNEEFVSEAFSEEELSHLLPVDAVRSMSSPAPDLVSLLPTDVFEASEADSLGGKIRLCQPTPYAVSRGAFVNREEGEYWTGKCWWWLRPVDGGTACTEAPAVRSFGVLGERAADNQDVCVRPLIYVRRGPKREGR